MIVRMYEFQPIFRILQPFFSGVSQDAFNLRTDIKPAAVHAGFSNVTDRGDLLHDHAVFNLRFGLSVFCFSPLRQIPAEHRYSTFGEGGDCELHWGACSWAARNIDHAVPAALVPQ